MSDSLMGIWGTLTFDCTVLDDLVHGAGNIGNQQAFRKQHLLLDGEEREVPFVSGNSLKHMIRWNGVVYALMQMGLSAGAHFSKAAVDLLASGGALTAGGGTVNLERRRRLCELFPILSVCGFSSGNDMHGSLIKVSHLHFVCEPNLFRLPSRYRAEIEGQMPDGMLLSEQFGTRHDQAGNPLVRRLMAPASSARADERKAKRDEAKTGKDAKGDSQQMIYSMETVRAGARGVWRLHLQGLYKPELFAVLSALAQASTERSEQEGDPVLVIPIGGKTAVGWGRVSMRMTSTMRTETIPPELAESFVALTTDSPNLNTIRESYQEHLRSNRDEILAILEEAAK